jgi:uncharacterized protein YvpB
MKLDVPYYSQYRDIKDENWQRRACGLVCLKMVLDFHEAETPEINELLKLALEKGAYHETNGWIHDKLLGIAESFGVAAYRKERLKNEDELKVFLDKGNPVIVSISAQRFLPEFENKFHQIVLTGYDKDGYFYNDSDSQGDNENGLFVSTEKFGKYWRKMAIFMHKIDQKEVASGV